MADGRHDDDYALSDEQKAAVAELSRSNVYAKQSKWKTLHELPIAEKWPYFKENFLSYAVIIASDSSNICDSSSVRLCWLCRGSLFRSDRHAVGLKRG